MSIIHKKIYKNVQKFWKIDNNIIFQWNCYGFVLHAHSLPPTPKIAKFPPRVNSSPVQKHCQKQINGLENVKPIFCVFSFRK